MNELEVRLNTLLSKATKGTIDIPDALVEEFGQRCKDLLIKQFNKPREKDFRLRMSNIGKDLRQLHMEKLYGEAEVKPQDKLKFIYGDIIEALVVILLKHSGLEISGESGSTELQVAGESILGEYDIIYKDIATGEQYLIDVKSASPSAYDYKFVDYDKLKANDSFGYRLQGFGYDASSKDISSDMFKGWFVVDKVSGRFKFVDVPKDTYQYEWEEAIRDITEVVTHFKEDKPLPPCPGVKKETWYSKETGEVILADGPKEPCQWCPRKTICHPDAELKLGKGKKSYWYLDKDKEITYDV